MERRARLRPLVPLGILVGVQFAVVDPLNVLRANAAEFSVSWLELLWPLSFAALAAALVILLLGLLVPARRFRATLAVLSAVVLLSWVQSSFLAFGYGVFDGRSLERIEQPIWRWLDLGLWALVVVLAVRMGAWIQRRIAFVSYLLLTLLIVGAVLQGPPDRRDMDAASPTAPPESLFEISATRSVLHILLDSFQTDIFLELVEEFNWKESFSGFTVYRQNMGVARWTSYSLPAIFSGDVYDGSMPFGEYYSTAMNELSVTNALHDGGYRVHLVPQRTMLAEKSTSYFPSPSAYGLSGDQLRRSEAALLLDLALFRRLPHGMRQLQYDGGNWFLTRWAAETPGVAAFHQKAFFRDFVARLHVEGRVPSYHFIHLMPPHPPYVTRADGSYAGEVLPQTRANLKIESRYILEIFVAMLDRLRALDVHDGAMILLHADHGSAIPPRFGGKEFVLPQTRVPALLAIKLSGAAGPMQIRDAQSSVADIAATIAAITGLSNVYPGRPVHEIADDERRSRPFFIIDDARLEQPVLTRFEVYGDVFDSASWSEVGSGRVVRADRSYDWGTTIQFGLIGNADRYKGIGWSTPSNRAEWTDGKVAELHLDVDPPEADVQMTMIFHPFVLEGVLDAQWIALSANGVAIAQLAASHSEFKGIRFIIPRSAGAGGTLDLRFELPDAVSPLRLVGSGDARQLGIFVGQIVLQPQQ